MILLDCRYVLLDTSKPDCPKLANLCAHFKVLFETEAIYSAWATYFVTAKSTHLKEPKYVPI